jgi:hypothetical protein
MRNRLQRAERRAYEYQDKIRDWVRKRDGRMAVNAAVAHLQSELSKRVRHSEDNGVRVQMLSAGIVEHLAEAVPEYLPEGSGRPTREELLDLFERGLRKGHE